MEYKCSVFGGNGYVLSEFVRQNPDVHVEDKFNYIPTYPAIVYGISTVHNYHVKTNPHLDIDTNLRVLISILENARNKFGSNVDFTFLSSWFVYGSQTEFPVKEDAHCNPKGFYSITKLAAEQLLASYCETYDIEYRILRLANVIGGVDKKASNKKNALQYMINTLCDDGEINLYDSDTYRDYIDVRDVARAITLAMNSKSGEVINIASGITHRIKDLVYFAHDQIKRGKINLIPVPEFHKQVQTHKMILDDSKIRSMGFILEYTVYDTITDIIEERMDVSKNR